MAAQAQLVIVIARGQARTDVAIVELVASLHPTKAYWFL